jgi:hypothetical protein
MSYKFEGEIKLINKTQTWDSGFKKREIIVTSNDMYPQDIKFEFLKDDVELLDAFKKGQKVVIDFNLRGNEYQGKYYTNLNATSISKLGKSTKKEEMPDLSSSDDDDDIPF